MEARASLLELHDALSHVSSMADVAREALGSGAPSNFVAQSVRLLAALADASSSAAAAGLDQPEM